MLIAYSILLVLYISLAILYAFTKKNSVSIPSWPLLFSNDSADIEHIPCKTHADCPANHVCLNNQCIPKFLKDGTCSAQTGQWKTYDIKGKWFAICQCTNEKLFTQPTFGADCTLSIACGVHGNYDIRSGRCKCDPGFEEKDLRCRKMTVMEFQRTQPCASDEKSVSTLMRNVYPFHEKYLSNFSQDTCVKNPCTFDALTGRPLKNAFHKANWGCVCNPLYGLFGVRLLPDDIPYLQDNGFNACASIFTEDPEEAVDVKCVTYFYIQNREPLSIILFENVPTDKLQPHFKNINGPFMLSDTNWKYDFSQFLLSFPDPSIRLRIRREEEPNSIQLAHKFRFQYYIPFTSVPCTKGGYPDMDLKLAYKILYQEPVCLAPSSDHLYGDRYILRPEHVLYQKNIDDTPRYNAFVLEYEAYVKKWTLDIDYPYKVDFYREEANKGTLNNARWYS